MKDKKALTEKIAESIESKLKESGDQPKIVIKAVKKSAAELVKKLTKIFKKIDKKKKKAEKKAKSSKKNNEAPSPIIGAEVPVFPKTN